MRRKLISLLMAMLMLLTTVSVEVLAAETPTAAEMIEAASDEVASDEAASDEAAPEAEEDATAEQFTAEETLTMPKLAAGTVVASGYCGTTAEGADGTNLTWTLDDAGTLTISGTGEMGDYDYLYKRSPWYNNRSSITSVVIDSGVTGIGQYAFYGANNMVSITIGNDVTRIGSDAFEYCRKLTGVVIPASVNNIEPKAFYDSSALANMSVASENTSYSINNGIIYSKDGTTLVCCSDSHKSVTIPNTVTTISPYAFYCCTALTSVTIPNGVTTIGDYAFDSCSNLTSISLPVSVRSIGTYALAGGIFTTEINVAAGNTAYCSVDHVLYDSGATKLIQSPRGKSSITIPNTVTTIGSYALYGARYLESVTIPAGVKTIGDYGFASCALTSVTIPDSVTSIGAYAFQDCHSLKSVVIGDGLTSIPNNAFYWCYNITTVSLGSSITDIGDFAFYGCKEITSLVIPDSVKTIGKQSFQNCESMESLTIGNSVTTIGSVAFKNCFALTSVTLPDSVTKVDSGLFDDCNSLKTVTIGKGLTSGVDYYMFYNVNSIEKFSVSEENPTYWADEYGALYHYYLNWENEPQTSLVCYPNGATRTDFDVPATITSVYSNAFYKTQHLTHLYIPDTVTVPFSGSISSMIPLTVYVHQGSAADNTYGYGANTTKVYVTETLNDDTLPTMVVINTDGTIRTPFSVTGSCISYKTMEREIKNYTVSFDKPYGSSVTMTVKSGNLTATKPIILLRLGDVNGTGDLDTNGVPIAGGTDVQDMQCLYTYLATGGNSGGIQSDDAYFQLVSDVNGDGEINILDYQALYEMVK